MNNPLIPITTGKVLVVEDDEPIRTLLQLALSRAGLNVRIAVDGDAALEAVRCEDYSLILLDLNLPKINGFEFLKSLKEKCIQEGRKPLVIVVSAVADLENLDGELVALTIRKPFQLRELQTVATEYIQSLSVF